MDYAFEFIIKNGGMDTEDDYPYAGLNGKCDLIRVSLNFLNYFTFQILIFLLISLFYIHFPCFISSC